MKRRTSALSVSVAALAVAAPLLTGCSADSRPGAAAVVGEETITVSQIQHQVEQARETQYAQEDAESLVAATGDLPRVMVQQQVMRHLVEQAAERLGIDATRREVQAERARFQAQFPNEEVMEREVAAIGLGPLDQLDDFFRMEVLFLKLNERAGPDGINEVLAETAEEVGVEINPRYGEWDNAAGLTETDLPWLRTAPDQEPEPASLEG